MKSPDSAVVPAGTVEKLSHTEQSICVYWSTLLQHWEKQQNVQWWSHRTLHPLRFFSTVLPASEFWGQLGKEVGGGPGAGMWQGAGFVVGQSGRGGWRRVHRGSAVPQLPSVKGAANCGAASQAASVWGWGWGGASPRDAQCGWRCCRHAVTQGAAGPGDKGQNSRETLVKSYNLYFVSAGQLQVESRIMI